jgi:hypothetical protein
MTYLMMLPDDEASSCITLRNVALLVNTTIFLNLTTKHGQEQEDDDEPKKEDASEKDKGRHHIQNEVIRQDNHSVPLSVLTSSSIPQPTPAQKHVQQLLQLQQQPEEQLLENLQPESTVAERRRFLKARKGSVPAASSQLGGYLLWRETNRIDEFFPTPSRFSTDADDWILAARGAMELNRERPNTICLPCLVGSVLTTTSHPVATTTTTTTTTMTTTAEDVDSSDGSSSCRRRPLPRRVIHVLPCLLNSNLATPATYALAVALYLDRQLDRSTLEQVIVVIDIRAGQGWTNPSTVQVVPFLKLVVSLLNSYFPERLHQCLVFPLPYTATLLFQTVQSYLDPDTAAKIQVCAGSGSRTSPVPTAVANYLDPMTMNRLEERRQSLFL